MDSSFLALPDEVLILILAFMRKRELKCMRLMSHFFEALSTPLLFDRVYFSGFQEDLNVLKAISQHERLRYFVKEIVCCSFYARGGPSGGMSYKFMFKEALGRFPNVQNLIVTNDYLSEIFGSLFEFDSPFVRDSGYTHVCLGDGI